MVSKYTIWVMESLGYSHSDLDDFRIIGDLLGGNDFDLFKFYVDNGLNITPDHLPFLCGYNIDIVKYYMELYPECLQFCADFVIDEDSTKECDMYIASKVELIGRPMILCYEKWDYLQISEREYLLLAFECAPSVGNCKAWKTLNMISNTKDDIVLRKFNKLNYGTTKISDFYSIVLNCSFISDFDESFSDRVLELVIVNDELRRKLTKGRMEERNFPSLAYLTKRSLIANKDEQNKIARNLIIPKNGYVMYKFTEDSMRDLLNFINEMGLEVPYDLFDYIPWSDCNNIELINLAIKMGAQRKND
jgi:hypothetical protein